VNGNIFWFLERQAEAIANNLVAEMNGLVSKLDVQAARNFEEYQDIVDSGNASRTWGSSSKTGWYRNKNGISVQNWPFSLAAYATALIDFEQFRNLEEIKNV
jgi:capsule polysaccharide export protein KpsE/RkpR